MPKSKYQGRGKVLRYRTIRLPEDKYLHVAVMGTKGKRGGRTISGKVRKKRLN